MQGIYRFFINGDLVAEQHNMLSLIGRRAAIRSMVGATNNFADQIVVGVGDGANQVSGNYMTNTSLDFEVMREPVTAVGMGLADDEAIIFSGRFTPNYDVDVREIGLLPTNIYGTDARDRLITSFDDPSYISASGSAAVTENANMRVNTSGLFIPNGESATYEFGNQELSFLAGLSPGSTFYLSGYKSSASAGSITINFIRADDTSKQVVVATPASAGYFVVNFPLFFGQYVASNLPNRGGVNNGDYVSISFEAAEDTYLDAMRVNDTEIPGYQLASRAVLTTPILLRADVQMNVEYRLLMGFNV